MPKNWHEEKQEGDEKGDKGSKQKFKETLIFSFYQVRS